MKLELTNEEAQLLFNVLTHPDTKYTLMNASLVMPLAVKLQTFLPKPPETVTASTADKKEELTKVQ